VTESAMPVSAILYSWPLNFTTFCSNMAGNRIKFSLPEPGHDNRSMHIGLREVPAILFALGTSPIHAACHETEATLVYAQCTHVTYHMTGGISCDYT